MKRNLRLLVFVLSFCGLSAAQMSTVTAGSGGLKINGNPVNGTVTIVAQSAIHASGNGLFLEAAAGGRIAQCSASSGAITGSCSVPDSVLANSGNGVQYSIIVADSFAGKAIALNNVSISGASWALDQYSPASTVTTAGAFTYTTGSGAPGGNCSSTSLYADTSGGTLAFYGCKGGTWTTVGNGVATVTLGSITALGTLPNNISGTAATATELASAPTPCQSGQLAGGVDAHGNSINCATATGAANLASPGPIGATTPGPINATTITAQSVQTTGSGAPGGFTATANGSAPNAAPANSITYGVPAAVPTPYVFIPPTNVSSATSNTPMQCQYSAAPPATLTCTLAAVSGGTGSGLATGMMSGVNNSPYDCLTFGSSCANGQITGLLADTTQSDKKLYIESPSGGYALFRVNGSSVYNMPSGPPPTGGSNYVWANANNSGTLSGSWILPSTGGGGMGNGITTGVNGGTYSCITFNGSCANGLDLGLLADTSGSDKNIYNDVPATGAHIYRIGSNNPMQVFMTTAPYGGITFDNARTSATMNGVVADTTGSDPNLYVQMPTNGQLVIESNNVPMWHLQNTEPTGGCSSITYAVLSMTSGGTPHLSYCPGGSGTWTQVW